MLLVKKWIGMAFGFFLLTLVSFFLCFNIYAVPFKKAFDLTQTQVELVAGFTMTGMGASFIGGWIFVKFGYRTIYISGAMVAFLTFLLMTIFTKYATYFRDWFPLICMAMFMNSMALVSLRTAVIAIGVLHFTKRRGLFIGVCMTCSGLGKIYYTAVYQIFFHTEGGVTGIFLSTGISVTAITLFCFAFHSPPNPAEMSEESHLPSSSEETTENGPLVKAVQKSEPTYSPSDIVKAKSYHLIIWPNSVIIGACTGFMTNIAVIAKAVNINPSESPIYLLGVCIVLSRLSFSYIFDYFKSTKIGLILLVISYGSFSASMLLGILQLDEVTLYIMVAIASMGIAQVISLPLAILTTIFGSDNYTFLDVTSSLGGSFFTIFIQLFIGISYDHTCDKLSIPREMVSKECFFWPLVLLFAVPIFSMIPACICLLLWEKNLLKMT